MLSDASALKNEMLQNLVLWGEEDVKPFGGHSDSQADADFGPRRAAHRLPMHSGLPPAAVNKPIPNIGGQAGTFADVLADQRAESAVVRGARGWFVPRCGCGADGALCAQAKDMARFNQQQALGRPKPVRRARPRPRPPRPPSQRGPRALCADERRGRAGLREELGPARRRRRRQDDVLTVLAAPGPPWPARNINIFSNPGLRCERGLPRFGGLFCFCSSDAAAAVVMRSVVLLVGSTSSSLRFATGLWTALFLFGSFEPKRPMAAHAFVCSGLV